MGMQCDATCQKCGHAFPVCDGGGFSFHLLRCDTCGKEKSVDFASLGELHGRYLKGLSGPYSIATRARDEHLRAGTPGPPISEEEYHAAVEAFLGKHRCGGRFRFDAPPRCPKCRSIDIKYDEGGPTIMYD